MQTLRATAKLAVEPNRNRVVTIGDRVLIGVGAGGGRRSEERREWLGVYEVDWARIRESRLEFLRSDLALIISGIV